VCFCPKEELSQPIYKKKGWPTNVGGKGKKPKRVVATKKEDFFSEFDGEKGNNLKWIDFEVGTLIEI
jgi:hypothetical protein